MRERERGEIGREEQKRERERQTEMEIMRNEIFPVADEQVTSTRQILDFLSTLRQKTL